jgi:hypothetical protein
MALRPLEAVKKDDLSISPSLAVKAIQRLYKKNRELVTETIKEVEKPAPYYDYIFLFPKILSKFCEVKGYPETNIIGVDLGGQRKWEQTIFVAVILKLYSEAVFKQIYDIENGVRHNLAGMLECNEHGISQTIPKIIQYMGIYDEFRDQVVKYTDIMKEEFKVKRVEDDNVGFVGMGMFE